MEQKVRKFFESALGCDGASTPEVKKEVTSSGPEVDKGLSGGASIAADSSTDTSKTGPAIGTDVQIDKKNTAEA